MTLSATEDVTAGLLLDVDYQLDASGNRDLLTQTFDDGVTPEELQFDYTVHVAGPGHGSAYDDAPAITGPLSNEYDGAGNLTEIASGGNTRTFGYDHANRLAEHSAPEVTSAYYYDALGRRIAKEVNGTFTRYIHDGHQVVGEQAANGTTQATYVYGRGLDEPVSMRRDVKGANGVFSPDGTSENYYYLLDDQNNAWFLADHQGNVVEAYAYRSGPHGLDTGSSFFIARNADALVCSIL